MNADTSLVLVDSCCWIEALRKDGRIEVKMAVKYLLDEYKALLCGPVEYEVLSGARKNERDELRAYFNVLPYRPSDHKIWRKAAESAWKLRDAGVKAPHNDVIIATIAAEFGYRIFSIDKHFELMAGVLGFSLYVPGYGGLYNPE
ncbi:PIN domain-containing protein [Sulfuriroseicoccus oceanibius]|uniref:PIN domain-containing protein n=1 Tax=Sulfuriroseicoccus oceanibius TaxID=2707525 RepID=A0A6B3LD83_9BACT|nr:PIN domain-containing protein [Sulfuriroseicoccus oceanibius]QQL45072.1 PIN domain-containing protein [Sulfuriroseicoccus oceanibius]